MTLERRIHELNAVLHAAVMQHADELADYLAPDGPAMEEIRAGNMLSIGARLPVPPAVVPAAMLTRLGRLHRSFRAGLEHVFQTRMNGSWDLLADELLLEDEVRRYLRPGRTPLWATIGRPDVVLHGDSLTMAEPNVGTSCGAIPDSDILSRLFESAPVIGEQLKKLGARRFEAVATMADLIRARLARLGLGPDALVVVSDVRDVLADPDFYHADIYARELCRYGLTAESAAAEDLDVGGGAVTLRGRRVGAIYRMFGEQSGPEALYPVLAPLLDAAVDGWVALVDDLGDQIAGNKTILAVLSEELDRGSMPGAVRHDLSEFIPWTRLLREGRTEVAGESADLVPWCLRNQEDLVIKPGSGFQGRGVTLGCEVTPAAWREAIDAALGSPEAWLVQRLVRSSPISVAVVRDGTLASEETFADYGYYAMGSVLPGGAIRRSAPYGTKTRRIKRSSIGPVFYV